MALSACTQEEMGESKAILPSSKEISLPPIATSKTITIYADGTWVADVTDTWLSISPNSGSGSVDVTLNVEANSGTEAREAKIIVKGSSSIDNVEIAIKQKYDRFTNVSSSTVAEVYEKEENALVKMDDCQIMAKARNGFVVADNNASIYVTGDCDTLSVGAKVSLTGDVQVLNGLKSIKLDDIYYKSSASVTYPSAVEVSSADVALPTTATYIKFTASFSTGNKLLFAGKQFGVVYEPIEDYSKYILNDVAFEGYYIGVSSGAAIVVTSSKLVGKTEILGKELPFKDDFSWLAPFIEAANAQLGASKKISDCVSEVTSSSDGAANIYTTLVSGGVMVLEELRARGYTDINPEMKTIYLQDQYFKYGATSKTSGLVLPNFKIEGSMDLIVSFKWCAHFGGTGKVDPVPMVIEIVEGPGAVVTAEGEASVSDPVTSTQKDYEMFWNDAMFKVVGATASTRIAFHPGESSSSYLRYYLDDIEVISASEMVEAQIIVEGVENDLITFEGNPQESVNFTVTASQDFTVSSTANWLELSETEGVANDPKTFTLSCLANESSNLRKAELIIKANHTSKKIQVVQSAAGAELQPFISIVEGNSMTTDAKSGTFKLNIQSNVDYKVDIDASWIAEMEQPLSKALVEVSEHVFSKLENDDAERTAKIRFYNEEYNIESVLTLTQLSVMAKLPVRWTVSDKSKYSDTWPVGVSTKTVEGQSGYINAIQGLGTIWFNNENGVNNDANGKCKLDINTENPRVFGVWKNDYCQFKVPGIVPSGKKVRISFETRVSATHPKYWRLQYKDGETWKDAAETLTAEVDGEGTVSYTHQMASDGKTNIQVDATVTYGAKTEDIVFRFIAVTAMQASGAGLLPAPNGGSWRLAVTDTGSDTWQPTIRYVE